MFVIEMTMQPSMEELYNQFPRVVLEVLAEAIVYWQREIMPKHFEPGAVPRYGYKARTAKYLIAKRRMRPTYYQGEKRECKYPNNPLMYTGESARQLVIPLKITYRKQGVRGSFVTNNRMRYFWQTASVRKSRKGNPYYCDQPNKPDELMRLTQSEARDIRVFIVNEVVRRLGQIKTTKKVS